MSLAPTPFAAGRALICLTMLALVTADAPAQNYRISQRATVSQMLGATKVSLDYSRPLARNRPELFGKVVIWGELWTPGANEASVLEVSDTIQLNGKTIPTGRWSMWVIPSQVSAWELVLDPKDSLFHTQRPSHSEKQIIVPLEVTRDAPYTDALTWTFENLAHDGATLRMRWDAVQIDLAVGVKSLMPSLTVAADQAARYVGDWTVTMKPPADTIPAPPPFTMSIVHTKRGVLRTSIPAGVFGPPPKPEQPIDPSLSPRDREREEARRHLASMEAEAFSYAMVAKADGIFQMGYTDSTGVLYETNDFFHEFEFEGQRAVRMSLRGGDDEVFATAVRAEAADPKKAKKR